MYKPRSLKITNIISFKDQVFEFRNGKAVMIVGQNLDDSSQNGNGAGKSSLIEAISLAFDGKSIRDVKTKELIYNDEKSGEVEIILDNNINGTEFKVWRKLYGNTKSAEYAAWIDGKEQSKMYSDFNSFNEFVWKTIGISREDFFNFFLITKESYTPFLLVGDTKKKEIINRFSGADKVDNALPLIAEDSEKLGKELATLNTELTTNTARQELLVEQLMKEEEKVSEDKHKEEIINKSNELINQKEQSHILEEAARIADEALGLAKQLADQNAETCPEVLQPFIDEVEIAELEVETFEYTEPFDEQLEKLKSEKSDIETLIVNRKQAIPLIKNQFKTEIEAITVEESELKESLTAAELELKENEKFESDVNKQLLDSIECPKCKYHFSLKDEKFDYEAAKAKLPEVATAITEYKELIHELKNQLNIGIQTKKTEINDKIIKVGEGIKTEIEAHNSDLIEIGNKELAVKQKKQVEDASKQQLVNKVNIAKDKLKNEEERLQNALQALKNKVNLCELTLKRKNQEFDAHRQNITNLEAQIEKLENEEVDRTKIVELEGHIGVLVIAEDGIRQKIELKTKEKESVDAWEIHFKGFKSHLANKSIKNIQDYNNLFLENMGSNLAIEIDGYKALSTGKLREQISTRVLRDGFNAGSYGKFSGGERGRIDICSIIAMQELIMINAGHGKGLDMLLADEILESIDTSGMESIINSLQSLGKTIMLVSQNEINALAEYTLTIQKKNKVSTILN